MVCKLCPTRKHCWDKGNCQECDYGKAFEKLNRKIKRLKAKNEALKKENEELKDQKQSEGEWVDANPNGAVYKFTCTLCGETKLGKGTPYCPNCGAKMKGTQGG